METEITRRVANAWRSFFSSEEGMAGLAWIMSQRPKLEGDSWQKAAGFEDFKTRIDQILETEPGRRSRTEDQDELKS